MALSTDTEISEIGNVKPVIPNTSTPPCEPPPLKLPLKPEQLRTLSWMLKREALDAETPNYLSTHLIERRFAGTDLCLQVRVQREYSSSRGGILAQQMGFGKTALVIALLALDKKMQGQPGPLAAGTLVITPGSSALHSQWQEEVKKFLGDDFGGLSVFAISTMKDFKAASKRDLQKADVVIVNGDFFLSNQYRKEFDSAFGVDSSAEGYQALRYAHMRAKTEKEGPAAKCFLEQFEWERVVFDEFHKLVNESKTGLQAWRALHEIQASKRWGLTGTPDVSTALSVSEMAALLHVFVPPDSRLEAQRFLDVWVRADAWDSSHIKVISHMILLKPSAAERTLYHATKRMLKAQGELENAEGQTSLLHLCSHFSPEELAQVDSCDAAVKRAYEEQQKALEEMRLKVQEKERTAALAEKENQRRADDDLKLAKIRFQEVESALGYFTKTIAFLEQVQQGGKAECPVCMDSFQGAELSVTRCGHVFCSECLRQCFLQAVTSPCPSCRRPLNPLKDYDEIGALSFKLERDPATLNRYGTKIGCIVEQIQKIQSDGERVLVFIQWRHLLAKIASALEAADVPCLYLKGNVAEQQLTINSFSSEVGVGTLLLALEDDDSGLNLTCANHAIFVHAMDVKDRQLAVACERQALGRIRRRGQNKDVHVYRFIMQDTIEETLARKFHEDLLQD